MLGEANLVRIFGVGLVAVDSLGAVRIFCGRVGLGLLRVRVDRAVHAVTEARHRGVALGRTSGTTVVAGHRGGGLEAIELGRRVHLGLLLGNRGLRASTVVV